jgi:hypothetical protein
LPFNKLDSVGRLTPSAAAAAVTVNPAGSTISVRIKSPGWGGLFMGIACFSFVLVVIFQIHFADFALGSIDAKGQPQIAGWRTLSFSYLNQTTKLGGGWHTLSFSESYTSHKAGYPIHPRSLRMGGNREPQPTAFFFKNFAEN